MIVSGEVRKVLDESYRSKANNKLIAQAIIVIEPASGKQNYEVTLNATQINAGMKDTWLNLRGQLAAVAVNLFVNHEYKFHKLNAVGSGEPLEAVEPDQQP